MSTWPELELDRQLCFRVYRLHRAITARYRPYLDALGLTYPQYLVMLVLWEQDCQSVSSLGDKLRLDSGTLSPLLKRLEERGLLNRTRSSRDERSIVIQLTSQGREIKDAARSVPGALASCFHADPDEYFDLVGALDRAIAEAEGCRDEEP